MSQYTLMGVGCGKRYLVFAHSGLTSLSIFSINDDSYVAYSHQPFRDRGFGGLPLEPWSFCTPFEEREVVAKSGVKNLCENRETSRSNAGGFRLRALAERPPMPIARTLEHRLPRMLMV